MTRSASDQPLKLEVGKSYRTRNGLGPIRIARRLKSHFGSGWAYVATDGLSFEKDGRWRAGMALGPKNNNDLIAEWDGPELAARRPGPADLNVRLGAVIREKRILLGLSQDALGQRIGVTFQQIQKYEKGRNQVHFPRLVDMARALETSVIDLVAVALGEETVSRDGLTDRQSLELLKRISGLKPKQRRSVLLLVHNLAEAA